MVVGDTPRLGTNLCVRIVHVATLIIADVVFDLVRDIIEILLELGQKDQYAFHEEWDVRLYANLCAEIIQ